MKRSRGQHFGLDKIQSQKASWTSHAGVCTSQDTDDDGVSRRSRVSLHSRGRMLKGIIQSLKRYYATGVFSLSVINSLFEKQRLTKGQLSRAQTNLLLFFLALTLLIQLQVFDAESKKCPPEEDHLKWLDGFQEELWMVFFAITTVCVTLDVPCRLLYGMTYDVDVRAQWEA